MALAIIKWHEKKPGKYIFEADIGTNGWYEYKVGASKRKYRGMEFVDQVSYQSKLMKSPVKEKTSFLTRYLFDVKADIIDKDNRFIQLFSYKDRSKKAPAISEVLTVTPAIADLNDDFKLPKMMTTHQETYNPEPIKVQNAPFDLKENKISEAFFFNTLLGALPSLLTSALPVLKKILPGMKDGASTAGKIADTAGKILPELANILPEDVKSEEEGTKQVLNNISPETIKSILEIIQAQTGKNANGANSTNGNGNAKAKSLERYSHDFSINPATLMQLAPLLEKVLSPETIKAIGDNPVKLFKAVSDSALKLQKMELDHLEKINPGVDDPGFDKIVQEMQRRKYSKATVAPALLAALPALMPVLEKVLSPDMIKAIGDQPVKLFNAIADAGLKHSKQELQHLENINPGVDDPAFDKIVNSMSTKSAAAIGATFNDAISIKFLHAKGIHVAGKDKIVYDKRQKITLPVQLNASEKVRRKGNKSIPKGIFQLMIQDGDTMQVLLEKKYKLKEVAIDSPLNDITLNTDEIKSLPAHKDLKVELTFNWRKDNKTQGTFINHYIMLTEGYLFQRPGDALAQHFALNDLHRFRNYWHKLWEGGPTSHERWEVDFECKYYYDINQDDSSIKKLETRKKKVSDSAENGEDDYRRKMVAKLKSGMNVSVEAYNELLKAHDMSPLSTEQLAAFKSEAFTKGSGLAARVSVAFRGKKGETSTLWAYPEGNIKSYILGKAVAADATGMVTELEEEEVQFPQFSSVHFIGTQSE